MDQVTFEKFETCGSIVRNKKVRWYYDGKSASSAWSTNNTYSFVNNKAQYDFYSYQIDTIPNPYLTECYLTSTCFSLTIKNSFFNNFNLHKTNKDYPVLVDTTYKMQYRGIMIDLDGFKGPVKIMKTSLNTNYLGHTTC